MLGHQPHHQPHQPHQQHQQPQPQPHQQQQVMSHLSQKRETDTPTWILGDVTGRAYSSTYATLESLGMAPLPDLLLQQMDSAETKCFMGLLGQIGRVWLSIDHRLFLWNYADNSDFYSFEGMDDVILAVALVPPRPNLFDVAIQHLLVLVSASEIKLIGLSISSATGELALYETHLSVFTDSLVIFSIGYIPETAQILLGARDGHLYELEYDKEESWFRRRCQLKDLTRSSMAMFVPTFAAMTGLFGRTDDPIVQIAVDSHRNWAYALTENSLLHIFQLVATAHGDDRLFTVHKFATKTMATEVRSFLARVGGGLTLDKDATSAIAIHVIPPLNDVSVASAVKEIALMVTSARGYRFYFGADRPTLPDQRRQPHLDLVHVRALPSLEDDRDLISTTGIHTTATSAMSIPLTQFDTAYYNTGSFFCAGASATSGNNTLFHCVMDMAGTRRRRAMCEIANFSTTTDRIWDIVEVEHDEHDHAHGRLPLGSDVLNDLYEQVSQPQRRFKILTNQGIYTSAKKRPIDYLSDLLVQSNGQETEPLRRFIDSVGLEEACAMCLALACDNRYAMKGARSGSVTGSMGLGWDSQVSTWAAHLFYRYGAMNRMGLNGSAAAAATAGGLSMGGLGRSFSLGMGFGSSSGASAHAPAMDDSSLSVAYHALLLYFSRLVRPLWTLGADVLSKYAREGRLAVTLESCTALRSFVGHYVQTVAPVPHPASVSGVGSHHHHQQQQQQSGAVMSESERVLLDSFVDVIEMTIQGIQCLSIILPAQIKDSYTFGSLVTLDKGQKVMRDWTRQTVEESIQRTSNIDAICETLRQKCPKFFDADDMRILKAREILEGLMGTSGQKQAQQPPSHLTQRMMQDPTVALDQASQMLIQSAQSIDGTHLKLFGDWLRNLGAPDLTVRLGLACARCADKVDLAGRLYESSPGALSLDKPVSMGVGSGLVGGGTGAGDVANEGVRNRMECYKFIFEVVDWRMAQLQSGADGTSSIEALERTYRTDPVFVEILASQDTLAQYLFFDHLVERKQLVHLLKSSLAHSSALSALTQYLEKKQYDRCEFGLYLCLLYRNLKRYTDAVNKLYEFAMNPAFPAPLQKRIDLLTMALNIGQSGLATDMEESVVRDLQDLLDVAHVQVDLIQSAESRGVFDQLDGGAVDLKHMVTSQLLDINDLYRLSDEYGLDDVKLSIFSASDEHDDRLILNVWRDILAKCPSWADKHATLHTLVKKYAHNSTALPLDTLLPLFESEAMASGVAPESTWVCDLFVESGYTYQQLLDVYHAHWTTKRPPFHTTELQMSLLEKMVTMLLKWVVEQGGRHGEPVDRNDVDERVAAYKLFAANHPGLKAAEVQRNLITIEQRMLISQR